MRKLIPGLVVIVAAAVFSAWAYPQLPAQVATHFDLNDAPNGWSSRLFAVAFVPALGLVLAVLFSVLPRIDPRRANYEKFGSTYWTIMNAVLILLAGIHVFLLGKALGWPIDMTRVAGFGAGGILVLLGNLMTRLRPNWFMGIRTPWTLSSDTVWRKTHRFGGVAFVIAGLCVIGATFAVSGWALYVALGITGVAALSSVVYSYLVWKREQDSGAQSGSAKSV